MVIYGLRQTIGTFCLTLIIIIVVVLVTIFVMVVWHGLFQVVLFYRVMVPKHFQSYEIELVHSSSVYTQSS